MTPGPAAAPTRADRRRAKQSAPKKQASLWKELPILIVVAVGLAFVIKSLFVQAFYIPSESMEHTLIGCAGCTGDRVLVNKLVYDFRDPHRGEIIVFRRPPQTSTNHWPDESSNTTSSNALVNGLRKAQSFIGLGGNPDESDFIKRVIGVGGDVLNCPPLPTDPSTCAGITVNGHQIDESSYLYETHFTGGSRQGPWSPGGMYDVATGPITVPKGELFVMGDHRDDSADSRFYGFVPVSSVIGKAFVKVWPPARIGGLGVPKVWQQNLSAGTLFATNPPVLGVAAAFPIFLLRRRRRRRAG